MANAVIMPKAGITVESCIIGEWLKNVGDQINVGDILFTYETDKASFECESTAAGTLLEIFFEAGDEVEIDFDSGIIKNITKGKEYKGQAFPPFMQEIINKEGLVNYINSK